MQEFVVAVATITHVTGVPVPIRAEKVTVAPITKELALIVGVESFVLPSVEEDPVSELAASATDVGVATVIPDVVILTEENETASFPKRSWTTANRSLLLLRSLYEMVVTAPGFKFWESVKVTILFVPVAVALAIDT